MHMFNTKNILVPSVPSWTFSIIYNLRESERGFQFEPIMAGSRLRNLYKKW